MKLDKRTMPGIGIFFGRNRRPQNVGMVAAEAIASCPENYGHRLFVHRRPRGSGRFCHATDTLSQEILQNTSEDIELEMQAHLREHERP